MTTKRLPHVRSALGRAFRGPKAAARRRQVIQTFERSAGRGRDAIACLEDAIAVWGDCLDAEVRAALAVALERDLGTAELDLLESSAGGAA